MYNKVIYTIKIYVHSSDMYNKAIWTIKVYVQ